MKFKPGDRVRNKLFPWLGVGTVTATYADRGDVYVAWPDGAGPDFHYEEDALEHDMVAAGRGSWEAAANRFKGTVGEMDVHKAALAANHMKTPAGYWGEGTANKPKRVDSPPQPEPHSVAQPPAASLRERLAMHFGLAPDAPEDVVFSSACRAWDHFDEAYASARVSIAAAREARDSAIRRANNLADECGQLNYDLAKARDEVNELLAENARLRRNK